MPKQRLTAFYYIARKERQGRGTVDKPLTFYAINVDEADRYAQRWCRKRGYRCFRKRGKDRR